MSVCQHGLNRKHQHCYVCEDIAKAEGEASIKAAKSMDKKQRRDLDRHIEREDDGTYVIESWDIPEIDLNALEKQWVEHPKLTERFADRLALAKRKLAKAEQALEETDAKVKLDIRKKPEEYDLDKVTEDGVKSALVLSSIHKSASDAVIEAQYQVDHLNGKMKVCDHRKTALENEVVLLGQNYFSAPRLSGEDGERMREVKKRDVRRKGR